MTVENILKNEGLTCDTSMSSYISAWKSWYKGYVSDFHNYKVYNGKEHVELKRMSLKMAKRICEDWANLLLNEKVLIKVGGVKADKKLKDALTKNDFYVRANQLLEKSFAFGSGAMVEYADEKGRPVIDYITADMIYPISWEDTYVTECAFASVKNLRGEPHYYINIHLLDENGNYIIKNKMYHKESGVQVKLPDRVAESYETHSSVPRFQIIRPNITNNHIENTALGISVFANALNELKGVDCIYDSYINEFVLGKKRIIVPTSMTQIAMENGGEKKPVFDSNDVVFYALPATFEEEKQGKLQEINMELRSNEHKEALQFNLGLLSDKCGLGNDRYSFDGDGAKTATEVISEKSDLFRNLKKHEIVVKSVLIGMVKAILEIMNIKNDVEISIEFDDSIIEDHNAEFTRRMQMLSAGAILPWEMRTYELGEAEETAKNILASSEEDIPEV